MRLLVIGGTSFVGRHVVEAALAAGDEVTLANRGITNADLFGDLEHRTIDRQSGSLVSLADGRWDATIDVTAYVPRHVAELSTVLGKRAGHLVFVSTGSVYDTARLGESTAEDAPRLDAAHDTEEITEQTYGPLKVACEDVAWADFGGHSSTVRPGIVAGPHDPTDRFTYWPRRLASGGPLLLPRRPDQPVQVIDGRDLGAFLHAVAAHEPGGTYNAVGDVHLLAEWVRTIGAAVGNPDPVVTWADPAWLADQQAPRVPLVLDAGWDVDGLFRRANDAGKAAGLVVRPLGETAADTLEWDRDRGLPPLAGGPTPEQERALLAAWAERT